MDIHTEIARQQVTLFQECGIVHPLTCSGGGGTCQADLVFDSATPKSFTLRCPACGRLQTATDADERTGWLYTSIMTFTPNAQIMQMLGLPVYGLWDKEDGLWLGDTIGPKVYHTEILARAAATILDIQMGWRGRIGVKPYDGTGTKMRDEVTTKMSVDEALDYAEGER